MIDRIRKQAKAAGLTFEIVELTRHTAIRVGDTCRTLGRHHEIDDLTAKKFFGQFADEFGQKGWWR